jgi:hypothetical protein
MQKNEKQGSGKREWASKINRRVVCFDVLLDAEDISPFVIAARPGRQLICCRPSFKLVVAPVFGCWINSFFMECL